MMSKRKYDDGRKFEESSELARSQKRVAVDDNLKLFAGFKFLLLQAGIGKARSDIFKKQIKVHGGECVDKMGETVTHIIVDEKMDYARMLRILKVESISQDTDVAQSLWLSQCIKHKYAIDITKYLLSPPPKPKENEADTQPTAPLSKPIASTSTAPSSGAQQKHNAESEAEMQFSSYKKHHKKEDDGSDADSDYVASGDELEAENTGTQTSLASSSYKKVPPKGRWVCAMSSGDKRVNHNKHITDKLEGLARIYESTNDRWRALGYQKAIMALKRHSKTITSFEEAKALPGVGERLANKVWEIVESGELQKLTELSSSEEMQALELFTNIWGAGAATARAWVTQGFRTLDDLREKATLTRHQQIGLHYFDELLDRMPHSEAGEIEQVVKEAALTVNSGLTVMACGSYRREKQTCGDVDVLITHSDGKSHKGIFSKILDKLKGTGFLTDDLVSHEENGNQKKYMGICKLPGEDRKHRRLDIIVVPHDEYACAVMYFTGSAHFNRSMRNLASKMGWSLNEHSLNVGVVRKGQEKLNKGTPVPTPTEESIFQHFGIPYRSPPERDH